MIVLVDHHLEGYVVLLQGALASEGWFDLLSIRFVLMEEAGFKFWRKNIQKLSWLT